MVNRPTSARGALEGVLLVGGNLRGAHLGRDNFGGGTRSLRTDLKR